MTSELPRAVAVVAAIWQLTLLVQVLVYLNDYRQPAVPVVVWLGMLVAAAWLVPRARAGGLTGMQSAVAVAVALAAVVAVGWDRARMERREPWTGRSSGRAGCSRSSR